MRRSFLLMLLLAGCATQPAAQKFVVFFQEFSPALDQPARGAVGAAARWAQEHPRETVTVAGYAGPKGNAQANADLSLARAQAVVEELVRDGVPAARIGRSAHGATDFTQTELESRRVEILVAGR